MLGLSFTCSYAQNKGAENSNHQPTITTQTTSSTMSLEDQVKHLEIRLEQLKSRQPAISAEELQKIEMRLADKRRELAAQQAMIEKRRANQK